MKQQIRIWNLALLLGMAGSLGLHASAAENPADIAQLRAYLVRQSDNAEGLDVNGDGVINAFDLVARKQALLAQSAAVRTVRVATTQALLDALKNAQPGDDILVAPGTYVYGETGTKGSLFRSAAEGTAEQPIRLRSEDPQNPAVLSGTDMAVGLALYLTGDYWQVESLHVTCAQKGIVLDHSNHSVIRDCTVSKTGSEGIHLRDNSSFCLVTDCTVTDTGQVTPGYGEAVYVGSSKSSTAYGLACDQNVIANCVFGPGVTAELVDIKEGTTGTIVERCTMYGDDIKGDVSATSLLNAKGNDAIIRHNIGYRNGNAIIRNAFEVHCLLEGWGENNDFFENTLYLDEADAYILRVYSGSARACGNVRSPEGNLLRAYDSGVLTEYENN